MPAVREWRVEVVRSVVVRAESSDEALAVGARILTQHPGEPYTKEVRVTLA